jgi:hypothetical protein
MPTATKNNPLLAAALRYAEQGLPVFPCVNDSANPDRHKKPHTKHDFKDATTNLAALRAWWGHWPNALIGMPTGKVTGIAVLDLDKKNGKDGFAAVPDWERRSPVQVRTVSDGAHLYFQDADELYCSDSVIAPGVDTRATGGYVIVPPSPGYRAVDGFDLTTLPPWPDDLSLPERKPAVSAKSEAGEAEMTLVAAALAVIPNDDLGWSDWNRIGMAAWRASGGSDEGLAAFAAWSAKSGKHDADTTDKRWKHFAESPPTKIGAGTLFYEATQADPGWRERVVADLGFPDVGKKGGLLKSLPNTVVALLKLGMECKHDLFKLRYVVNGHQLEQFVGDITDPALLRLRELIHEQFRFDPATQTVHDAVRTLANHHRYHPVRDYLDSLKWDGAPRLDSWLSVYCKAKNTPYTRAVGSKTLVAAVRRLSAVTFATQSARSGHPLRSLPNRATSRRRLKSEQFCSDSAA